MRVLFDFFINIARWACAFNAKEIDAVKPIKMKINTRLATEI